MLDNKDFIFGTMRWHQPALTISLVAIDQRQRWVYPKYCLKTQVKIGNRASMFNLDQMLIQQGMVLTVWAATSIYRQRNGRWPLLVAVVLSALFVGTYYSAESSISLRTGLAAFVNTMFVFASALGYNALAAVSFHDPDRKRGRSFFSPWT